MLIGYRQSIIVQQQSTPQRRDPRSSVRTNEHPNRLRSLSYVDKHNILSIHRLFFACGRSNERPYGLVRIACGLVRGRHKARPLQLGMVWCGRTNVRPYGLVRIAYGLAPSEHTNITLTYTHCGACPFVAVRKLY